MIIMIKRLQKRGDMIITVAMVATMMETSRMFIFKSFSGNKAKQQ